MPRPLPTSWLPPSARRALSRTIARRNAFDRALAVAKGLAPDDPRCARFQGVQYQDELDRSVRVRRGGGLRRPPTGAMADGIEERTS